MTKVCVIGAGSHSQKFHGPALAQIRRDELIECCAVCDLDLDKAVLYAKTFGFQRTYADFREMIATEEPDALICVTPLALTETIVSDLLPLQIPLLIEKPPGGSSAAARRLYEGSILHGTPVMVSMNRRFIPHLNAALRYFKESRKTVSLIDAKMLRIARGEEKFISYTGVHLLDAVLYLLGDPERVRVQVNCCMLGGDYGVRVSLESNEQLAQVLIAPQSGSHEETYMLVGDDLKVEVDVMRDQALRYRGKNEAPIPFPGNESRAEAEGTVAETRQFMKAVREGCGYNPGLRLAGASLALAEKINWIATNRTSASFEFDLVDWTVLDESETSSLQGVSLPVM